MFKQLRCLLINCQAQALSTFALGNIVLLYFRFYINKRGKLIRLTVFHCERTATQNIILRLPSKIVDYHMGLSHKDWELPN